MHVVGGGVQVVDDLLSFGEAPSNGKNALRVAEALDAALGGFYPDRRHGFWERL